VRRLRGECWADPENGFVLHKINQPDPRDCNPKITKITKKNKNKKNTEKHQRQQIYQQATWVGGEWRRRRMTSLL
jgi:hypothetical protein